MSTETTLPQSNGTPPPEESWEAQARHLEEIVDAECADLRELLAEQQVLSSRIQQVLDGVKDRERRIAKALAALEDRPVVAAVPKRGRPRKTPEGARPTWRISDAKLETIYDALVRIGQGRNPQIAEAAGSSPETTRRALRQLREAERVRVVAKDRRYGSTFAPMPERQASDGA